jgi:nucleoid DNA-binding protein
MAKKKSKSAAVKARSKSQIISEISEQTELTRKEVTAVFDGLAGLIKKDVGRRGPGVFTVPGLLKIKVIQKPATKARKGINPFTKEPCVFKAKPARRVVKAQPLKALKEMGQ